MSKLNQVYILLILLSLRAKETSTQIVPKYAMEGCEDKCGAVRIPYPFGIGANCSVNAWYIVNCTSSTPYLSAFRQLQVLRVDLGNQTVTVNTPIMSDCNHTKSLDLSGSPFFFSRSQNKFVFEGCGNAFMMDHGRSVTGCSTTCGNDSVNDMNNCLGISCCQTTIPHHLKSYNMNLTGVEGDRACRSALLVDRDSYVEGRFSVAAENNSYVPISLLWTLSDDDFNKQSCCYTGSTIEVDLGNGTSVESLKCRSSDYSETVGNIYLSVGCSWSSSSGNKDPKCAKCRESGGYCNYEQIYDVDGLVTKMKFTSCYTSLLYDERKVSLRVILGVSISMEKSDVYSFGVVLVELLTRERPISLTRFGENRNLATHFLLAMEEGRVMSIFDATVVKEGTRDDLLALANLATRCLNLNGKYRPTMKEVAIELETIRSSHIPSGDQTTIKTMIHGEELSMVAYGESSSTFGSLNESISQ
ncbi:hypothetical protein QVD17_37362 [Tagetes erecta]|uniref:Wall-associated receptor kinase galacturonan-binding domain-containing protein n=1 Tax=Tagetes erecta TaxID=13708 RepID=A0AAD8NJS6_TARER|nr:hypothetical protein QVD17_37362 [Tagetes erecta]